MNKQSFLLSVLFLLSFQVLIAQTTTTHNAKSKTTKSKSKKTETTSTSGFDAQMLAAVNKLRASGCDCGGEMMPPVKPLKWESHLTKAAQNHANDMAEHDHFDHFGTDGSAPEERIAKAGWTKTLAIGENIGMGYKNIAEAMEGWKNSPHHCKAMMDKNAFEMGAARNGKMWCQDFGKRETEE